MSTATAARKAPVRQSKRRLNTAVSLRRAISDPELLGGILGGPTWIAWRVLLIAAMGEALTDDERVLFTQLTGRAREPGQRVDELVGVIGRRGGKSRAVAALAAYLGGLCDWTGVLAKGETGVLLCIAPDQRQARITLDYATAAFEATPLMRQLIASRTNDALELTNGITIEVRSASFRRLRGPTYIGVVCDEAGFYFSDESSANSDAEILNAVRPGLATTGGLLALISSPHAKRGELWQAFKRDFGAEGDPMVLVAQGASRLFNPSLPEAVVTRALQRDEAAARAEFLGLFRDDLAGFISRELVEAAVDRGVYVRPPLSGVNYFCAADPSGGLHDSFTAAIAHAEGENVVLDAVLEKKAPFNPSEVVLEVVALMRNYRCSTITGDRYSAMWVVESFAKEGVTYVHSDRNRSEIYLDALPLFTAGRTRLIENLRMISQFAGLERRISPVGRDRVDHSPGGFDDVANSVALALVGAQQPREIECNWVSLPGWRADPFDGFCHLF
jgi:hypothetical protein